MGKVNFNLLKAMIISKTLGVDGGFNRYIKFKNN